MAIPVVYTGTNVSTTRFANVGRHSWTLAQDCSVKEDSLSYRILTDCSGNGDDGFVFRVEYGEWQRRAAAVSIPCCRSELDR